MLHKCRICIHSVGNFKTVGSQHYRFVRCKCVTVSLKLFEEIHDIVFSLFTHLGALFPVIQTAATLFGYIEGIKGFVVTIHIPQFFSHPFVPFQRFGGKVEPGKHTHSHQYIHALFIGFRQDGFNRVFGCKFHTAGIQFGRIEGFTYIVIHIGSMFAYIFFIAENFLNDHHIHFQLIHGTDQLSPLIIGHLLNILIPMFSFDFAPVIDARPGTGYLLDRANIRFNHFYIFCLPIGLAFISHFEDHFILPHPVLGRYNHLNRFDLSGRDCHNRFV